MLLSRRGGAGPQRTCCARRASSSARFASASSRSLLACAAAAAAARPSASSAAASAPARAAPAASACCRSRPASCTRARSACTRATSGPYSPPPASAAAAAPPPVPAASPAPSSAAAASASEAWISCSAAVASCSAPAKRGARRVSRCRHEGKRVGASLRRALPPPRRLRRRGELGARRLHRRALGGQLAAQLPELGVPAVGDRGRRAQLRLRRTQLLVDGLRRALGLGRPQFILKEVALPTLLGLLRAALLERDERTLALRVARRAALLRLPQREAQQLCLTLQSGRAVPQRLLLEGRSVLDRLELRVGRLQRTRARRALPSSRRALEGRNLDLRLAQLLAGAGERRLQLVSRLLGVREPLRQLGRRVSCGLRSTRQAEHILAGGPAKTLDFGSWGV